MQPHIFSYCIVLLGISLLAACSSKTPKELKLIPNDASTIMCINTQQIHNKLETAGISVDSVIQKLIKTDTGNTNLLQQYQQLQKAGINWNSRVILFKTTKVYANKSYSNFISLIMGITDSGKLSAYLTGIDYLKGRDIHHEKNYAFIQWDGNGIVSWNKENAIVTLQDYTEQPKGLFPDSIMRVKEPDIISKVNELKKEVNRYYTESTGTSMSAIPLVQNLFKTPSDGYFYSTTTNALNTFNTGMLQLPKLNDLLNNNITTGTFNFEKGKIVANTNFYPNKLVKAILETFKSNKVKTGLIEHYPSKNIDFAMLMAFNPEMVNGILQQLDVAPLVDGFLDKSGIPSSTIYNAFTGDMALVISDLNLKSYKTDIHKWGKFLINMPIGNPSSFHTIMNKVAEAGWVVKEDKTYKAGKIMEAINLTLFTDDKNMIITNDTALLKEYNTNRAPIAFSDNVLQLMQNSTSFLYADINNIIHTYTNDSTASNTLIQHTFKDLVIKGEPFNGNTSMGNYVLRMQNTEQNSLVSILQLFPYISEQMQKNRNARKNNPDDGNESIFNVPFSSRLGSL